MFTMDAIHPVSDFSRKPAEHIKRLRESKQPEILTVNGKAALVIQDARAYEENLGLLNALQKIAGAAKAHDEGRGLSADDAFNQLNARLSGKYPDAEI